MGNKRTKHLLKTGMAQTNLESKDPVLQAMEGILGLYNQLLLMPHPEFGVCGIEFIEEYLTPVNNEFEGNWYVMNEKGCSKLSNKQMSEVISKIEVCIGLLNDEYYVDRVKFKNKLTRI